MTLHVTNRSANPHGISNSPAVTTGARMVYQMLITVTNHTRISDAPHQVVEALRRRLTFPNLQYTENEKRGFSNWNVPEMLCYLKEDHQGVVIPRGFTRQAIEICRQHGIEPKIQDNRRVLPQVEFTFTGQLRDYQQEALQAVLKRDHTSVSIPTGGGKTVLALGAIAERKQPALIIVHTKELADQWISRIETFLGIPRDEIGLIGNGKRNVGEKVTVALVQSLLKCAHEVSGHIGHLIADECHRIASRTYTEAVTAFDCRYTLGLSATPYRDDGLGRLIYWYIGDRVFSIDRKDLIESHDILPAEIITRETEFQPTADPSEQYSTMLSELTEDPTRNMLIASDVVKEASNGGGVCLVLSDRKAHCELLQEALRMRGVRAALLTGDLPNSKRKEVIAGVESNTVKVVVATSQLVGEGLDLRALSTLFLATPIKFSGRLIQCLGRVLRPAPGKDKARVYDYVDVNVGVLLGAARSRAWVYRGMKGETRDEA